MSHRRGAVPVAIVALICTLAFVAVTAPDTAAQPVGPTLDKPLFWMGDPANPAGTLYVPFGVAAAPDGTLYIADTENDRIQHVAADGGILHVWGTAGPGPTQLNGPRDVAVGADGTVYVADSGNSRIGRFRPDGALIDHWRGGTATDSAFRVPYGLAIAPDGTVFVADSLAHRVQRFAPDGAWLGMWGARGAAEGELNEPSGLAVASDGTVYVADLGNQRIQHFTADGRFLRGWGKAGAEPGQFNQPWDLAVHPDGTLFVTDRLNHRVQHFSPTGEPLGSFGKQGTGAGELSLPTSIAVAPDGSLVLTDMNNARVQRLGTDGAFLWQWGGPAPAAPGLHGLAAGPDGSVYVLDGGASLIRRLDMDGRLLGSWGRPGSGDGEFQFGDGMDMRVGPDGIVHVLDGGNRRVQSFAPDGAYLGQWPIAAMEGGRSPAGFARAPDGTFLVGDSGTNRVRRFDPTGAVLAEWGGKGDVRGRYYGINDIGVAPGGEVYVVDHVGVRVQVFDPLGRALAVLGGGWDGTCLDWARHTGVRYRLVVAADGSLYGTNDSDIVHWRPDGTEVGRLGTLDGPWLGSRTGNRVLALAGSDRLLTAGLADGRPHLVVFGAAYASTWRVEYFGDRWLGGWVSAVQQITEPALDWGGAAPAEGLPADGWSARLSRVTPLADGAYRFTVRASGGARLWLDNQVLLDRWSAAEVDEAVTARVMAGAYALRLEYNDPGGAASLALEIETVDALSPTATATPTDRPTPTPYPFKSATPLPSYTPNPRTTPWPTDYPNRLYLPQLAAETGPETAPTATPAPPPFAAIEGIDVRDYAIRLTVPDLVSADIEAYVAVTVRALAPLDAIDLHVEPEVLKVGRVEIGDAAVSHRIIPGRPNAYGLSGARLRTWLPRRLAAGDAVTLDIRYTLDAEAFSGIRGFMAREVDGARLLFTRGLPYYNRYWLPGNDHPGDAATASFELHVPDGSLASANGLLDGGRHVEGSGLDDDGLRVFTWRQSVPIPTYLMAVAVGDFKVHHEDICYTADAGGGRRVDCGGADGATRLPLVWYYPRSLPADVEARTRAAIQHAADAVVFYSGVLGPYPFEKLGFFSAPLPYSSEYASLIALSLPNGDRDVLHEVIHSWWGDAVRIPHWGDFWIKEGLTNYFTGYWDEIARDLFGNGYTLVNPCNAYPMRGAADLEPMDAFIKDDLTRRTNQAPYVRGAAVIHDLRHRIAEQLHTDIWDPRAKAVWLALMRGLYAEHRGATLGTEQLEAYVRAHLGDALRAAGVDVEPAALTAILDQWAWRWFQGGERGAVGGPGAR